MIYEDTGYTIIGKTPKEGYEVAFSTYKLTHLGLNMDGSYIAINKKVLAPINVDIIETVVMTDTKYVNFAVVALAAQNRINNRIVELGVNGDVLISMLLNDTINATIDALAVIVKKVLITETERTRQVQDCYRNFVELITAHEQMLNIE